MTKNALLPNMTKNA